MLFIVPFYAMKIFPPHIGTTVLCLLCVSLRVVKSYQLYRGVDWN